MTANKIHELDVTPHEGEHRTPVGWLVLLFGLVAWGAYYLWAYSPALSGWSQGKELAEEATLSGTSIFATILFTVVAALAAGAILLAVAIRKRG